MIDVQCDKCRKTFFVAEEERAAVKVCPYCCGKIRAQEKATEGELCVSVPVSDKKAQALQDKTTARTLKLKPSSDRTGLAVVGLRNTRATDIVIPATFKGKPIVEIGKLAFTVQKGLKSVVIGDNVKVIGELAFHWCDGLTSVVLGKSVVSISAQAFFACTKLKHVAFNEELKSIGHEAFRDSPLVNLELPPKVAYIGRNAFWCICATSITIADTIDCIEEWALSGRDLTIYCKAARKPSKWHNAWNHSRPVVWDCENNDVAMDGRIYVVDGGVRYALQDGKAYVLRQIAEEDALNIPETVTFKGKDYPVVWISAYSVGWRGLKKLTIPEGVTFIYGSAFNGCSQLQSVELPSTVKEIRESAFENCGALTSVRFAGTKAQWLGVKIWRDCWKGTPVRRVECTDGTEVL